MDNPFSANLDAWLTRTSNLLILIWLLLHIHEVIIYFLLRSSGFPDLELDEPKAIYLFGAIIAFAFAKIFKKGKEYKEENDLTV